MKRLPARKVCVGCGEQSREIIITDQAELRLIEEIINYIPEKQNDRPHQVPDHRRASRS